ncbi:hypothetical protein A9Q86_05115 [Flavobacteriales bacterium 33_180_T64]|nr:hypothetical protein A9Q86_05115 [Flavobacteriales bacterium 33_180_T64]
MNILKRLFRLKTKGNLVKVYSHPRSGTHFVEAFLAKNFYNTKNLKISPITWGHWSNRKTKQAGNPYGKLFGNHYFANRNVNDIPKVYIMRDGRAVAYSVWKTPNFLHSDLKDLSFSEFLKTKIDWYGTPSKQVEPCQTIIEHWIDHVKSWQLLEKENSNVLIINYEALVDEPYVQYKKIHDKFFKQQKLLTINQLETVKSPVGLLPNKAIKDSWRDVFNDEDEVYVSSILVKCNFNIEL